MPKVLGVGTAVVLGLGLGVPPAFAGPAAEPDPVPGLVAGRDTAAPQLVTGLSEPAVGADPAGAALAHLAAHPDRYRVDPAQLAELGTERASDGRRTVRFEQRYGGVPVLGGQYLVHLTGDGAGQRVESVGGKYFTGLSAPTAATVPDAVLRELALTSVDDPGARAGATAEDRGLVILPGDTGRLARHFTVRGAGPDAAGRPAREVYVDATAGVIALAHDARSPYPAGGAAARAESTPGTPATSPEAATGTAPDVLGRSAKVNIVRLPDGSYQLVDVTRSASLTTYDAAARDEFDFNGGIPAGVLPPVSPTPDFPAGTGTSGATDAHLNAGAVYDFYRDRLGREGLDGKGGAITSVVNLTSGGKPMVNAYWDGSKMLYGAASDKRHPFSVALDVAGHEMTHGVIGNTANLVYLGQSGAMNEALADYFGNAIEVTTRGTAMNDPRAALLGESLCLTGTPEDCADRRMDDHRTTVDDYLGVSPSLDSGGVHLNSTIFSGALWDIRRTLDPLTADRLVYRALAEYLTPVDDFVDGRNAVLAAGRALGLSRAQLRTVANAFDAHGIRAGWQQRIGLDSRVLLRDASTVSIAPAAAKGRWVAATAEKGGKGFLSVFTGAVTGGGTPTRISPADGRSHGWPATDGTSAAWASMGADAQGSWGMEVFARPLNGGELRSVHRGANQYISEVQVSGGTVAFRVNDFGSGRTWIQLHRDGAPAVELPVADDHDVTALSVKDGLLGWSEDWTTGETRSSAATVYSVAEGKVVARYPAAGGASVSSTVLAGGRVLWVETPADRTGRSSIRSGAPDGSGVTELLPGDSTYAKLRPTITASDRAVTFGYRDGDRPAGGWSNAALSKIWQIPITGGTPQRVSCNRGGQYLPAADQGTRVVWLDGSAGRTDLVVRDRPAGSC
ncbi:M4 family metallopeptidase [Kitasatospora sp. NPDC058406]|uniref:M4 family metallopeptidase n=1 Tax=Kitasatospora sp. NPDC058406 TaxID=3346483 RepID=UPI003663E5EE